MVCDVRGVASAWRRALCGHCPLMPQVFHVVGSRPREHAKRDRVLTWCDYLLTSRARCLTMPVIARQLTYIAAISASIAVFNLLPVSGLDGYYTLHVTLPPPCPAAAAAARVPASHASAHSSRVVLFLTLSRESMHTASLHETRHALVARAAPRPHIRARECVSADKRTSRACATRTGRQCGTLPSQNEGSSSEGWSQAHGGNEW